MTRAAEYSVGAGHHDRLALADGRRLHAQGAGDRSRGGRRGRRLARVDRRRAAACRSAPRAPAPQPGPVCYDLGGTTPTVTDASVLLGYLNPEHLVGGALKLNAQKARTAFEQAIARPLGMSIERAAYGAHQIAASNMIRAIKAVSTERGRDAREFALFAFGGNGPLFACGMAAALGMRRVVVPPSAGLFSSFGLLYADVEHHYGRTFRRLLRKCDLGEVERAWAALARQAAEQLAAEGFTGPRAGLRRTAALHYQGQTYELTVPVPEGPMDQKMVAYLEEAFGRGAREDLWSSRGTGRAGRAGHDSSRGPRHPHRRGRPRTRAPEPAEPVPPPPRQAYFGAEQGWLQTPVMRRSELSSSARGTGHRRGVRRHLRDSAGMARCARHGWKHPHRADVSPAIGRTHSQRSRSRIGCCRWISKRTGVVW